MIELIRKIKRKIINDFKMAVFRNRIRKFKNIHKGQDCIIMGAGPSLTSIPKDFLNHYVVIGTNTSYKYYIPKYLVTIDAQWSWFDESRKVANKNRIPYFICWVWALNNRYLKSQKFSNEISLPVYSLTNADFCENIDIIKNWLIKTVNEPIFVEKKGVISLTSVVADAAIPLAFYMGFERIYLAGVDFKVEDNKKRHFFNEAPGDAKRLRENDKMQLNFDHSYKDIWEMKKFCIEVMAETKKADRIFNLSSDSAVKRIPKIHYKDLLN